MEGLLRGLLLLLSSIIMVQGGFADSLKELSETLHNPFKLPKQFMEKIISGLTPNSPHDCLIYQEPTREIHPCRRQCIEGKSMKCYYKFKVDQYYSMSKACYDCPANVTDCYRKDCVPVDGISRPLTTVNRQIPGPFIEVCEGDVVIVEVENTMNDATTSIHWHGILQEGTPYMDGVPMVTQCPISSGTTFEYNFRAVDTGTLFWHSHTGMQRCDGVFGALVVRQPKSKTIYADLYDVDDHILVINDWTHTSGEEKLMEALHKGGANDASTFLVNGWGRYYEDKTQVTYTPLYPIIVEQGKRYRIRLIHAGCYACPVQVCIDNHTMTAIACDGHEMEPVKCDGIVMSAGERWDFILNADQPQDNYWMTITGLALCENTMAHTVVPIHYKGASCEEPKATVGYNIHPKPILELNTLNVPRDTEGSLTMPEIKGISENFRIDQRVLREKADLQIWLTHSFQDIDNPMMHVENLYGFYQVNSSMQAFTPQLNSISFETPTQPLLSQYCSLDPSIYCENKILNNCASEYCECVNIYRIPLNKVIEMIIFDGEELLLINHPFHLHGYSFHVVGMDTCNTTCSKEYLKQLDKDGKLNRNLKDITCLKDTVHVPAGGYTIVRFFSKNPGYWLFHCHFELHFHLKMALVIQVGKHTDYPPVPEGFPKCGDFDNHNKLCKKGCR